MPKSQPFTDHETSLIARALLEASNRHMPIYDRDFREDAVAGREMRAVLDARFPDFARAFKDASDLRKALAMGYLPPPGGATPEAVRAYLDEREAMKAAQADAARSRPRKAHSLSDWGGDSDLPF